MRFSGRSAWLLWRGIHLSKLPGLERKVRVFSDWMIELFFQRGLSAYGDRPIRVEGHADSIASDAYYLSLSERRAETVVNWLGAHGMAVRRMRSTGHGEAKPVADNARSEGRQRNRRVEIVVEKEG